MFFFHQRACCSELRLHCPSPRSWQGRSKPAHLCYARTLKRKPSTGRPYRRPRKGIPLTRARKRRNGQSNEDDEWPVPTDQKAGRQRPPGRLSSEPRFSVKRPREPCQEGNSGFYLDSRRARSAASQGSTTRPQEREERLPARLPYAHAPFGTRARPNKTAPEVSGQAPPTQPSQIAPRHRGNKASKTSSVKDIASFFFFFSGAKKYLRSSSNLKSIGREKLQTGRLP